MTQTWPATGNKIPRLVLLTGLSGAGKSSALKYLEDLGFFWIDNLPSRLLLPFAHHLAEEAVVGRFHGVAVGIHIRDSSCLSPFQELLSQLNLLAERVEIVFLEASSDILVTRYRETRRRHPLAVGRTVREAVEQEAAFMAEVRAMADLIIDTSRMNVPRLKERIDDLFREREGADLMLFLRSFGFQNGTNTDMDMLLDARFLPNPFYDPALREFSGLDEPVRRFFGGEGEVAELLDRFQSLFDYLVPRFVREKKRYLTVDIGCTGGKHRSVFLVEELAKRLTYPGVMLLTRHRDLIRSVPPPSTP